MALTYLDFLHILTSPMQQWKKVSGPMSTVFNESHKLCLHLSSKMEEIVPAEYEIKTNELLENVSN